MNFAKIAPYLQNPLVLIGFVVFLAFSFSRYLVKHRVIPELPPKLGFVILKQILAYGFLIGIMIIGLGFGLKYKELSVTEQSTAFRLLKSELKHNLITASELGKNMDNIIEKQKIVSKVLRTDGIDILKVLFSEENINPKNKKSVQDLVNESFDKLVNLGLINNELQVNRFNAAGRQINLTIENTLAVLQSLQDRSHERYVVKTEIWDSNLEIYRRINKFDITTFQEALTELNRVRTNYDITVGHAVDYLKIVKEFFTLGGKITKDSLYKVLSKERFSFGLTTEYSLDLIESMEKLISIEKALTYGSKVRS